MDRFTNLHVHSHFSTKDGLSSPEDLVIRTKELGQTSLAVTDHGNIFCWNELQDKCDKHGIKPIFACEFYIVENHLEKPKKENRKHICIFAKNELGMVNIRKMMSIAGQDGFHRVNRIDPQILIDHCEGLIVSFACLGSAFRTDWGMEMLEKLVPIMKDDIYIELEGNAWEGQDEWNLEQKIIAEKYGLKAICTTDAHYARVEESKDHEMLLCIGGLQWNKDHVWSSSERWTFDDKKNHCLKTGKEVLESFREMKTKLPKKYVIQAIENTMEIANKCDCRIESKEFSLPLIRACKESGLSEEEYYKKLLYDGLDKYVINTEHFKSLTKEEQEERLRIHEERIQIEWKVIVGKGFIRYFLLVTDIFDFAENNDIAMSLGRGSVGGSLHAFLLGISKVANPIDYNLLFSRFLNSEQSALPDCDSDCSSEKREELIQYLKDEYGHNNVAQMITFSYLKFKSSFKSVCRAFEIEHKTANDLVREIPDLFEVTKDNVNEFKELNNFLNKNPKIKEFTFNLIGCVVATGAHAGAVIVSDEPFNDGKRCSLIKANKKIVIDLDKRYAEDNGCLKIDVLAISYIDVVHNAFKKIKENHGVELTYSNIPLDDKKVFKMLSRGRTEGVSQFSGWACQKVCKDMGVDSFMDMVVATSIARPGANTEEIIKVKKSGRQYKYNNVLDDILSETYGGIFLQETAMEVFRICAGMDEMKVDELRRVISKSKGKDVMNTYKREFMMGCKNTGLIKKIHAEKVWEEILLCSNYSFCKAHAVSYTMVSYIGAWLKVNWPAEFYASLLTYDKKSPDVVIADAINTARIDVKLPKIEISKATAWEAKDGSLIAPFSLIHGVGPKMATLLGDYREPKNQGFFFDLGYDSSGLPNKGIELMERIGGFDKEKKLGLSELRKINELFPFDVLLLL